MSAYNARAHHSIGYADEDNGIVSGFRRLAGKVGAWREARRVYSATFNELDALSDRELRDIGISRFDIPVVARDAAKRVA